MRKRCFLLSLLCVSLAFFVISCSTTETTTEYVPVAVDLTDVIEPVFALRPDNSTLEINESQIMTLLDVTKNSVQYQKAWEMWQTYAEMLEDVIIGIKETYGQAETPV